MSKGPGLYCEIGEKARDLLNKDYQTDQKFTITTNYTTGGRGLFGSRRQWVIHNAGFSSSGTKKGELLCADVTTQLKNKNVTTDIKVDTNCNISTTIAVDEAAPGLKTILSFKVPDQRSGKLELEYLRDHMGICTSVELTANPIVNFSGVIGTKLLALGADVAFDSKTENFTKCNAGLRFSNGDLNAAVTLDDKGDTLKASFYHHIRQVYPFTDFAVGAEVSHNISSNNNTVTIGAQQAIDLWTTVKARVDNFGKAKALIQHEWRLNSLFTISGEVDTRAIEKSAKVGLALALKP